MKINFTYPKSTSKVRNTKYHFLLEFLFGHYRTPNIIPFHLMIKERPARGSEEQFFCTFLFSGSTKVFSTRH